MSRRLCCNNNFYVQCRASNDHMYIPYDPFGICHPCLYGMVENVAMETNFLEDNVKSLKENVVSLKEKVSSREEKVDFLCLSSLDHTFSDVVLFACKDGVVSPPIRAHKAILGSRSPVFKAMFETNIEESRNNTFRINDVSHDVLEAFIKFMYTAEACLDEQMACDLFVMSECYQVGHLKSYCENFLVSIMSPENSLMGYVFAQQHNAKELHDAAFKQITENMSKVIESQGYKELKKKDPVLLADIFEARLTDRAISYLTGDSSIGPRKGRPFECWVGDQFFKLMSAEPLNKEEDNSSES